VGAALSQEVAVDCPSRVVSIPRQAVPYPRVPMPPAAPNLLDVGVSACAYACAFPS
jgi:hypothetical protein